MQIMHKILIVALALVAAPMLVIGQPMDVYQGDAPKPEAEPMDDSSESHDLQALGVPSELGEYIILYYYMHAS